jgi:hypothetical protein
VKKKVSKKTEPDFPKVLETFKRLDNYEFSLLQNEKEPSCSHMGVHVERYKITVEKIPEPVEVYTKRLTKLWRECDNHHHWDALMATATRLGVKLEPDHYGKDRNRT